MNFSADGIILSTLIVKFYLFRLLSSFFANFISLALFVEEIYFFFSFIFASIVLRISNNEALNIANIILPLALFINIVKSFAVF